jgi:two-component system, NtrC family, response regulator HydG
MNERGEREAILVVDDSEDTLELVRRHLEGIGYQVLLAAGAAEAIDQLSSTAVDLVITDLKMPGISGLDLVRHVRENFKDTEVLMITGYPSVESAVEAMREGAADYLPKPFTAPELRGAVARVLERLHARRSVVTAAPENAEDLPGFVAAGGVMRPVLRWIREQVPRGESVFVEGAPGSGRRSVARLLHFLGPRAARTLIEIDCAMPFSENHAALLFPAAHQGSHETHAAGASASAVSGGTLYLHEALALPVSLQERIADAFLSPPAESAGRTRRPRLILSSSVDPAATVARGVASERLAGGALPRIKLPPLRDRAEDLLPLLRLLSRRAAEQLAYPPPDFTDRAVEALRTHPWPGNVTELWRTVRLAVTACEGRAIDAPDLPAYMRYSAHAGSRPDRSLAEIEAAYIQEVLASAKGNRSRAADILGIDRKTLRDKLRRG